MDSAPAPASAPAADVLIPTDEAAALLGVKPDTLSWWSRSGKIERFLVGGPGSPRYQYLLGDVLDLAAWYARETDPSALRCGRCDGLVTGAWEEWGEWPVQAAVHVECAEVMRRVLGEVRAEQQAVQEAEEKARSERRERQRVERSERWFREKADRNLAFDVLRGVPFDA